MVQPINSEDLVLTILFAILGVGIAVVFFIVNFPRCPKCKRRSWRKINGEEKIPGSEYESEERYGQYGSKSRIVIRVKARVFHECRICGHRFTVIRGGRKP